MNIKKTVKALLIINGLQFVAAFLLWLVIGSQVLGRVNPAIYLTIGIMLLSSLLTIMGLYMASRYQNDSYRESMKNLENLNLKLRAQRHDYMNHLQVIYGLLELGEYEDAREYMEPVFKDDESHENLPARGKRPASGQNGICGEKGSRYDCGGGNAFEGNPAGAVGAVQASRQSYR